MAWIEELGFSENPFYLHPVPADGNKIERGFIDRKKELENINNFAQLKRGKLLLLGRMGEGKSSILNVFEYKAKQLKKVILRVDIQKENTKEKFLEALLNETKLEISSIPEKAQIALDEKLDDLQIVKRKKESQEKVKGEVESKIGALIASIRAKIGAEEVKGEEVEYYVAPRVRRLEGIFNDFLPILFSCFEGVLICDNMEKLGPTNFNTFMTEIVQMLPSNILFVTTGDVSKIDTPALRKCYDLFDILLMMEQIDTTSELELFINGRIKAYSTGKAPGITINKKAIEVLLERTEGNLRECFRYCFFALQKFKKDIDESLITEAILEVDKPRFEVLDELEKKIMNILSSYDEATVKNISEELTEDEVSYSTLVNRLDNLVLTGLVRRKLEKKGRTHRLIYSIPDILKSYFLDTK
jgi:DNA-binding transcriptional ArsR family regulator